jgi:hypothetical protein
MNDEDLVPLIPLIKAWVDSVEARWFEHLESGQVIPGLSLVPKRPTRRWSDASFEYTTVLGLSDDQAAPRQLLSPAQIEKVLKDLGRDPKIIRSLTTSESSGLKLNYD